MTYNLSPFFDYLFYPKFLWVCFLQFFFIKFSNNFFTIEIINNVCSLFLTSLVTKLYCDQFWIYFLCFCILKFLQIANFKFMIFIINVFPIVNISIIFNNNRFHLNCSMTGIVVFIIISSNLSINTFFSYGTLLNVFLIPKLLNIPFASYFLINRYFLAAHIENFDNNIVLPLLVFESLGFMLLYFFCTLSNKMILFCILIFKL